MRPKKTIKTVTPKLACCNFLPNPDDLRTLARDHGFQGVDWSFQAERLPQTRLEESRLRKTIDSLHPLEVRYHCPFKRIDLGNVDDVKADEAETLFRRICRLVSDLGGRYLTIHIGLGRNSTYRLSWDRTLRRLTNLVRFADDLGICLCLENLAWGWTSRPELFEKLVRKSGCGVTIDIGHARVSPSIASQGCDIEDFINPHAERIYHAHVYHTERDDRHHPPVNEADLDERLRLLRSLPSCDWWVLELRETEPLLETLAVVRNFLEQPAGAEFSTRTSQDARQC